MHLDVTSLVAWIFLECSHLRVHHNAVVLAAGRVAQAVLVQHSVAALVALVQSAQALVRFAQVS